MITQVAKRKMEMLFVRGDGVILVRCYLWFFFLHCPLTGCTRKGITTIKNITLFCNETGMNGQRRLFRTCKIRITNKIKTKALDDVSYNLL